MRERPGAPRLAALLLDVDGTLLNFRADAERAILATFADAGIAAPPGAVAAYHEVSGGLWAALERKEITREELYAVRWPRVLARLGLTADGAAMERRYFLRLREGGTPLDGAAEALRVLAGAFRLYAASNAPQRQQEERLARAGLARYLCGVLTSEAVGADKPHRAFFTGCLTRIGTEAGACMMVGDSLLADVRGAREAGLYTCWVTRAPVPGEADLTVPALRELPPLLMRWQA